MSKYAIRVNERTEFLIVCDKCHLRTTSIEHKSDFMFELIICPLCHEKISMEYKGTLPESEFKADF